MDNLLLNYKDAKNLKRLIYVVVIALLAVCFFVVYYNTDLIENFNQAEPTQQSLEKDVTNSTVQVQENEPNYNNISNVNIGIPSGVSNKYTGVSEIKNINNNDTVITFNFNGRPNINNIVVDLLDEIAITDTINIENCFNVDQLAINYQTQTCVNERCYDRFGNKIAKGDTIQEIVPRLDINRCTNQNLGYLSFNFNLNNDGTVRNDTLFMDIETIYVGTSIYDYLKNDNNLDYYFRRNLFVLDNGLSSDVAIPRIVHSRFSRNNYQQKIIIKRYNSSSGVSDVKGNLAELFFRPGQFFLTADTVSTPIVSIENSSLNPIPDNYTTNFAVRKISQTINGKINTTAKCVLYPGVSSYIIDGGENYNSNIGVSIENDNGQLSGNFKIKTMEFSKSLRMKLRKDFSKDKDRAVWLIVPPSNFTPQGITKENKLTSGYILDYSDQSPISNLNKAVNPSLIPAYSRVAPGTIISPIEFTFLPPNGSRTTLKKELEKNNCVDLSQPDGDSSYQNCNDVVINGQNLNYYNNFTYLFNGEVTTNIFQDNSQNFSLNTDIYSDYPPYLLKAVNKIPAFADPKNLTTQGVVYVFVVKYEDDIVAKDFQVLVGVSPDPSIKTQGVLDNIILDGAAEFQLIDPFSETVAFRKDYFTLSGLKNGLNSATKVSNLTISDPGISFVLPTQGKISEININSLNYNNISLPNFDTSKIINLNSSTLSPDNSNGNGGSVGKDATGIVTFITEGTSVVISSFQVVNPGSDFTSGNFSLLASGLSEGLSGSIDDLNITVTNDVVNFEAIAVTTSDNAPIKSSTISENQNFDISYGLQINPVVNNQIGLSNLVIINGGNGYSTDGISIYINEYINNESVFGVSFDQDEISETNMKRLPYLNVTQVNSTGVSFFQPSGPALFPSTINPSLSYNFWQDSPGTYDNCPQQLVFYGDFIKNNTNEGISIYQGDPANDLFDFFLKNKIDGSAFTEIEFLTSLQIPSFTYQQSTIAPEIQTYEGLQLKRFIPYQTFKPPVFKGDEKIPTSEGNITYTNYNYCQFIPFGIENLYNRKFDSSNLLPTL